MTTIIITIFHTIVHIRRWKGQITWTNIRVYRLCDDLTVRDATITFLSYNGITWEPRPFQGSPTNFLGSPIHKITDKGFE